MIKRYDWLLIVGVAVAFGLGYLVADCITPPSDPAPVEEVGATIHSSVRDIPQPPASEPAAGGQEEVLPDEIHVASRAAPVPSTVERPDTSALPWRRFAVATAAADGRPRIVIVIDDLGVDLKRTARAIHLPAPLTLAFLAYAAEGHRQAAAARTAGHELLIHLPMEPVGHEDPGPDALLTTLAPDELHARLTQSLDRFTDYVGVNNHMGSKFTADRAAMTAVLSEIKTRGLLFLDSRTTTASVGGAVAESLGVPFTERNVFLDNIDDRAAIEARLDETEQLARRHGHAIAIGHPRDATLAALEAWLATVQGRGFVLVPVSAVVHAGPSAMVR